MKSGSSFQRKVTNPLEKLSGCYKSSYTHHILTSTGVPHLDILIGGGMPIGSLMIIEEDFACSYAKLLTKYFLSEGIYNGHSVLFSTLSQNPQTIIQNLPSVEEKVGQRNPDEKPPDPDDKLNIAWRYQNKTLQQSNVNSNSTRNFNLNISIPQDVLNKSDIEICDLEGSEDREYSDLIKKIHQHCKQNNFLISPGSPMKDSLIRIGILSLGDVLWGEDPNEILPFLLSLRALLRNCMGVGLVTIPASLQDREDLAHKIGSIADFLVKLTSFDSQENVSPVYKDYHGIIKISRISSLGVLSPPPHLLKDDNELVFKSRRNKFEIEKFHLPPDLSVTASRDQKDPKVKKNIDF